MREHLGELSLERCVDLLGRPWRHLLCGRLVVKFRGGLPAPAPANGILFVGMGEVELQDGLDRRGLFVHRCGKGRQPVLRLFVRELSNRLLAHEERACGVRPPPDGDGLARYLLQLVRDAPRKSLAVQLRHLQPCLVEIICHNHSIQRDESGNERRRSGNSASNTIFHGTIIQNPPPSGNCANRRSTAQFPLADAAEAW